MMLSGGVIALGGVVAIVSPRDGGPALGGARAGAAHGESHCPPQRSEVLLEGDAADDSVAAQQQQVK